MIEDTLATFASTGSDYASSADLKGTYAAVRAELEKSLAASEEKLADVERRIQEVENNKGTLYDLARKDDEAEARLKTSEEHVGFFETKMSKPGNQLLEKDASLSEYRERVVDLEQNLARTLADVIRLTIQRTADKYLIEGVRMVLAQRKTASQ